MLIRHHMKSMTTTLIDGVGFSHPIQPEWARERRSRALAELITTAALVVSLAIAVTAVSIGISRADTHGARTLAAPTELSGVM
jgi:hypothetical protein